MTAQSLDIYRTQPFFWTGRATLLPEVMSDSYDYAMVASAELFAEARLDLIVDVRASFPGGVRAAHLMEIP